MVRTRGKAIIRSFPKILSTYTHRHCGEVSDLFTATHSKLCKSTAHQTFLWVLYEFDIQVELQISECCYQTLQKYSHSSPHTNTD